jgi:hypothetical protein
LRVLRWLLAALLLSTQALAQSYPSPVFQALTLRGITSNQLIVGGGTSAAVAGLGSLGTTTTVLHGNAAGLPTFGAVSLSADVTGNLPVTNLNSGTSASSSTFWRGDGTWAAAPGSGTVTSVAQSFTGGLISVAGSPVTTSGTLALTVAGTSGGAVCFTSASTWASSSALVANAIVIGGGAGVCPSTATTATGALTFLGTPSSANLRALLTDESGTGLAYFQGGALGTPSSGTLTSATGLPLTTGVTGILPIANGGTATATPAIVAGTNVSVSGSWPNQTINSTLPSALLQEQQTSATEGGTFTSGAWQTRVLNTEVFDTGSLISISSNQFTPTRGGVVSWSAPAFAVDAHQSRLYNVTDAVVTAYGTSDYASQASVGYSRSVGTAQVVAGKAYRIEHRCELTWATNGLGVAAAFGNIEVYTQVVYTAN